MLSAVPNTQIKIFAKGFFRVHSGLLIFLFVMFVTYAFFIETAGDVRLLSPEELTFYHYIIVMTFIISPIATLFISFLWLVYAVKSWQYVTRQLTNPENEFLFYSTTSLKKAEQFKNWFSVQAVIFIPIIVYWLFASVFGIIFHNYLLPVIVALYIFILTVVSAIIYMLAVNRLMDGNKQSYLLRLSYHWQKPYGSLFLYQVIDKMKINYCIVKFLSYLIIAGATSSFYNPYNDVRVAGIIMLLVATAHSIIIYQYHHFEEMHLSFSRNLPYSRERLFFNLAVTCLVLMLPECMWLFTKYNFIIAMEALIFGLSTALLFRSALYWFGLKMNRYLPFVFFSFVLLLYAVLYNIINITSVLELLTAFGIFYKRYYSPHPVIK